MGYTYTHSNAGERNYYGMKEKGKILKHAR